jgi:hypothetical protein
VNVGGEQRLPGKVKVAGLAFSPLPHHKKMGALYQQLYRQKINHNSNSQEKAPNTGTYWKERI